MRSESYPNPFIIALLVILLITALLLVAGCFSPSVNETIDPLPTPISQVVMVNTPVSSNVSEIKETNGSLSPILPVESKTFTQNDTLNSSVSQSSTIAEPTFVIHSMKQTSDPSSHFYIVEFDTKQVTIRQNESYRIFVNLKVVNWKFNSMCAGFDCYDNLNTIPIKLKMIGNSDKEIKFTSFGGGGGLTGSADFHVGYEIRDLPVGKYTLEFSTPDSVFRKDLNII
jgi:hypothetical protein